MAALFQSLGRERNQAPVSKVKNTPAGLRGYWFIMLCFSNQRLERYNSLPEWSLYWA